MRPLIERPCSVNPAAQFNSLVRVKRLDHCWAIRFRSDSEIEFAALLARFKFTIPNEAREWNETDRCWCVDHNAETELRQFLHYVAGDAGARIEWRADSK